ncbi:MAG: phosphate ABC transporter ATP-binding protein [Gemmatimonadaceae bacterium]|nr:phosphate ABC transporter ATP-binding protein [Gemmatimonadaceae bacterium]
MLARVDVAPDAIHTAAPTLRIHQLTASYGERVAVRDVSLECAPGRVTAIIGPSGCGKSSLLRCVNRLHESVVDARVSGAVHLDGRDVYAHDVDPVEIRRRIGFVSQRPTPFPMMSIRDNVVAGLRAATPRLDARALDACVERTLRRVGLWDEVARRLDDDPASLSGGQQQRLCLARALAPEPRLLLLDEPTASLDPLSTQRVEELVYTLRGDVTVLIVTHNLQQAARVSDTTAFMLDGELIEAARTRALFTTPADARTEAYITGRFG